MPWSPLPQTSLKIPSDGIQAPGSGTLYIGADLPAELKARGARFGTVCWSDIRVTNPISYQYTFQCIFMRESAEFGESLFYQAQGSVNMAGTFNTELTIANLYMTLTDPESLYDAHRFVSSSDLDQSSYVVANSASRISLAVDEQNSLLEIWQAGIGITARTDGVQSWITDNTALDTWVTIPNHVAAVAVGTATFKLDVQYKITYDRVVHFQGIYQYVSGAVNSLQFPNAALPAVLSPQIPTDQVSLLTFLTAWGYDAGFSPAASLAATVNPAGQLAVNGTPNTAVRYVFLSGMWTVPKP